LDVRSTDNEQPGFYAGREDWRCRSQAKSDRPQHHRILVVDDHEDVREYLVLMLSLGGHEVESAGDGLEALEVAERFRPGMIFLDIQMPKLSGIEVCRRLREKQWAQHICIYAVTGLDRSEDHLRSRLCGFDGHLVKPVDPELIDRLVSRAPMRLWATGPRPD
jgi:CheY-like chemotaxis protein